MMPSTISYTRIELLISQVLEEQGGDILLIVPPFFQIEFIAVGPYILQAMAKKHGYRVAILQLDQLLGSVIGVKTYQEIQDSPTYQLLGERLFARVAHDLPALGHQHEALWSQKLAINDHKTAHLYTDTPAKVDLSGYLALEGICHELIMIATEVIARFQYDIVGLSIGFCNQINASIAFINQLKKQQANCRIIVGGSFCDGDKELGILSLSPYIDQVFSGESEFTFIDYLEAFYKDEVPTLKVIKPQKGIHPDQVPLPDYEAYAKQTYRVLGERFYQDTVKAVWYESNRGCWWADLAKCTFCGIADSAFRQKNAAIVAKDLEIIEQQAKGKYIFFSDLIMTESFPEQLLAASEPNKQFPVIGMQLKVGRTLREVMLLDRINVRIILPGIESFSTSLLKKMKKGTTGKQNLYFIRNTVCLNIHAQYSLLWGFPNDSKKEYDYLLELVPLITHLKPPRLFEGAQISRDAPLYQQAEKLGVNDLQAWKVYDMAYPPEVKKEVFANYYTGDFASYAYEHPELIHEIKAALAHWKQCFGKVALCMMELGYGQYLIKDTRMVCQEEALTYMVNESKAINLMSLQRYENEDQTWALTRKLGVLMDGWFVPIITANAELLVALDQSEMLHQQKKRKRAHKNFPVHERN